MINFYRHYHIHSYLHLFLIIPVKHCLYLTSGDGGLAPPESVGHWFGDHLIQQRVRPLHLSVQLPHALLQYLTLLLLLVLTNIEFLHQFTTY